MYSRLAGAIAHDPDLLNLLRAAPVPQQLPVMLFAAVHHALLADRDAGRADALAAWYPNLVPSASSSPSAPAGDLDPFPAFRRFALRHRDAVRELVASRTVQTNEIGRCALFLRAMSLLADEVGPLAHVDIGASAGLNLLLTRYRYRYEPGGDLDPAGGDEGVTIGPIRCATRGPFVLPTMPPIACAVGLDRSPVDIHDVDEVRWLEACVWPDQPDRFRRLVDAVATARAHGVDVRRGDAVHDVAALVLEAGQCGHPVVTTSWVMNYLTARQRAEFVARLDALADTIDLSWVIAESPAETSGLPVIADPAERLTVLSVVRWRAGGRTTQRLAECHPHGYWLHWHPTATLPDPGTRG